jgi:hypothetical protein
MNWRKDMPGVNEENERELADDHRHAAATNVAVLN